ncbi:MAG: hypothetical protein HRT42_11270 [Campylobacteraceae bacterium]|nr:hypothetical protein [Campylobacteraceae bacterium]
MIFESKDEHINSSNAAIEVRLFISDNFDIMDEKYPTLESIFGYLEYFISKKEGLGKEYTTLRITEIKEALIQLVHYVISKASVNTNGTYRKFWEIVSSTNRNI